MANGGTREASPEPTVVFLYPTTAPPERERRPGRRKGEQSWTIHDVEEWVKSAGREDTAPAGGAVGEPRGEEVFAPPARKPVHSR